MLRALIVEDESGPRDRLRRLLGKHRDEIEIVGEADSGPRALDVIATTRPDLVFLDVSLPGLDGFAVLDEIEAKVKVIFTTASQEHAVRAFDTGAVHYLLKPIDPSRLEEALARVQTPSVPVDSGRPSLTRLLCRDRDTTHVVRADEVLFMKADQGYSLIRTETQEYLSNDSLGWLEENLGPLFMRIHRNALVNVSRVSSLRHVDGEVVLVLHNGMDLPVSRRYAPKLRERLLYGHD
jgi:two-component system LytT family response regulator